jgi:S1-C subfamily serine protease
MWLTINSGSAAGRTVEVRGTTFVIGRDAGCDLTLADEQVSRRHAELQVRGDGRALLRDLESRNGTFVDGSRIDVPVLLQGGEDIQLGDTHLGVAAGAFGAAAPGPAPAAARPAGQSTMQRLLLRQSRRSNVLALVAIGLAVATAALLLATRDSGTKTASTADVIDAIAPSTVLVVTSHAGERLGSGTGWVLDAEQGLIVTNNHVVNGGDGFEIGLGNERREASLLGAAPCEDLAVLKVTDTSGLRTMKLGSQKDLRQGTDVVAVGFPIAASSRDELTATTGVVSVVRTTVEGGGEIASLPNVVRTDAAINPGNSGGPLVTTDKELVGVNTLGSNKLQNSNYAIGVDRVKEVTATLRAGKGLAWTGAGLEQPTEEALSDLQLPATDGLILAGAAPGTPAEKLGFNDGAVLLVAIDGHPIGVEMVSYCEAVGDKRAGDTATLTVYTPGSLEQADVEIGFG